MISLVVEQSIEGIDDRIYAVGWYRSLYDAVLSVLEVKASRNITVVLTDDTHMRELNASYRQLDRTTDVLSFLYELQPGQVMQEGELFISLALAQRQAKRYRTTMIKEMARLVVHGILHLYDYDHVKAGERLIMRGLTTKALSVARKSGLC